MQELVLRSELIAIGVGAGCEKDDSKPYATEVCNLSLREVFKGPETASIELITGGQIIELDVSCCARGAAYLIFAGPAGASQFASTNGQYGVYRIDDGALSGWGEHASNARLDAVLEEVRTMHLQIQAEHGERQSAGDGELQNGELR